MWLLTSKIQYIQRRFTTLPPTVFMYLGCIHEEKKGFTAPLHSFMYGTHDHLDVILQSIVNDSSTTFGSIVVYTYIYT